MEISSNKLDPVSQLEEIVVAPDVEFGLILNKTRGIRLDQCNICRGKPFGILETVMPKELDVISRSENGDILAVANLIAQNKHGNIFGLNYYLASELTPDAKKIIKNFLYI